MNAGSPFPFISLFTISLTNILSPSLFTPFSSIPLYYAYYHLLPSIASITSFYPYFPSIPSVTLHCSLFTLITYSTFYSILSPPLLSFSLSLSLFNQYSLLHSLFTFYSIIPIAFYYFSSLRSTLLSLLHLLPLISSLLHPTISNYISSLLPLLLHSVFAIILHCPLLTSVTLSSILFPSLFHFWFLFPLSIPLLSSFNPCWHLSYLLLL